MPAPRLERIRPCLHCGALMPYFALRCGSCGTPVAGAPPHDERVRSCLQCGVILRFDQDPCPQCGARARVGDEQDRVKPCIHCSAILPFEQLYCTECGELSIPIQTDRIPPQIDLDDEGDPRTRWPALLGGLAFAIGMATLLVAAAEILP